MKSQVGGFLYFLTDEDGLGLPEGELVEGVVHGLHLADLPNEKNKNKTKDESLKGLKIQNLKTVLAVPNWSLT